jgi:CRP/FNR family transcriptional regulator
VLSIYDSPTQQGCESLEVVPPTLALPNRTLEPGVTLYQIGREASSLYIVTRGVLKGVVPTSLGRDRISDLYGHGEVLGPAALNGELHPETVIAVHHACLTPIDPKQAMNDRELRTYICRGLAMQLRRSRERLDDAELPVGARVTRTFLKLVARFGIASSDGQEVTLPLSLTHEDLASLTGSSRVTITRILGELRSNGILSGTRGFYTTHLAGLKSATEHYVAQFL